MFDYLVAGCLTCDQALNLSDKLTEAAIEILDDVLTGLNDFVLARSWLNVVTSFTHETYQSGLSSSSGSDNSPDTTMDDLD